MLITSVTLVPVEKFWTWAPTGILQRLPPTKYTRPWSRFVIYWPSTEPSIKRCTCVNKRKNSRSNWTWDNTTTRCPGRFDSVGERMPAWEPACRLRVLRPLVIHGWAALAGCKRSAAMVRRTWVKITVCPCLQPPLTHKKHHPFENKVWEIYFYKEACSFVH